MVEAVDNDVFGYQERYAEYRYKPSEIHGVLRSTSTTDLSSMANTALDAQRVKQEFASIQSGIQLNQANATAAMAATLS